MRSRCRMGGMLLCRYSMPRAASANCISGVRRAGVAALSAGERGVGQHYTAGGPSTLSLLIQTQTRTDHSQATGPAQLRGGLGALGGSMQHVGERAAGAVFGDQGGRLGADGQQLNHIGVAQSGQNGRLLHNSQSDWVEAAGSSGCALRMAWRMTE